MPPVVYTAIKLRKKFAAEQFVKPWNVEPLQMDINYFDSPDNGYIRIIFILANGIVKQFDEFWLINWCKIATDLL